MPCTIYNAPDKLMFRYSEQLNQLQELYGISSGIATVLPAQDRSVAAI